MKNSKTLLIILGVFVFLGLLGGCGYNGLVQKREAVTAQWGTVNAIYQQRLDLIGNLVSTVKEGGKYEQETLTAVVEARAQASQTKVDANNLTPESIAKFESAQSNLSRLLVVMEQYPDLKATQGYSELRQNLTDIENKIAFQRKLFNDKAQDYNTSIKTFPRVLFAGLFGFKEIGYFAADTGAEKAPSVDKLFNGGTK